MAGPPRPAPNIQDAISVNVIDGVHVTFGPGLQVQNVKTGFESRMVILKDIPSKKTSDDIKRLLSPFGDVSHVQLPDVRDQKTMTVKATFATHDEASKAVSALTDTTPFGTSFEIYLASRSSTSLGKGSVHDGDVRLEFPAPCKSVYVGYSSKEDAEKAIAKAKVTEMGECELDADIFFGIPSITMFNVKIMGAPPDAKPADFDQFGPNKGVVLERPKYHDIRASVKELLRHLERFGEVNKITVLGPPFSRQTVIAWAHFKSPGAADSACRALHKQSLRYLGNQQIFARHTRTITYNLPVGVFAAIKQDIVILQKRIGASQDHGYISWFDARSSATKPVLVKLAAEQLVVLTRIKAAFETILRGERLVVDGQVLWDPFFSYAVGVKWLESLESDHRGVLINRDPRKRYISLFGPPALRQIVRSKIIRKVDYLRNQMFHRFPLDGRLIGLFVSADLMKLQEELGRENVVLDFATQTLRVRGNQDALQVTRLILRHAQERHALQRRPQEHTCPICFDNVSLPVTLNCGHSWCKKCLTDYLLASIDNRTFPMTCLGSEGRCTQPIPVTTVQELLSSEQFSEVTHASFLSYIHSRPSEFFYCPTPDCPQIYRTSAPDIVLQCPSCLIRICGKCHVESHEGRSCVDRDKEEQRLFQQWSSTRDVKHCPGCKTAIERIAGCNHMTCLHCKTHICWECLATFEKSGDVYEHMRSVHGGIGIAEW